MSFKCCHNCLLRRPGCHDACKDYAEEKAEHELKKAFLREKNSPIVANYISDRVIQEMRRKRNKR